MPAPASTSVPGETSKRPSPSSMHPKMSCESPSYMAQVHLKLLLLCQDLERVSLCVSKRGGSVSDRPPALLGVSPAGLQSQSFQGLTFLDQVSQARDPRVGLNHSLLREEHCVGSIPPACGSLYWGVGVSPWKMAPLPLLSILLCTYPPLLSFVVE